MTYKIALNFEDGVTRVIDCAENEIVTDAAFRQKINVPMDCRDGVCGTCKCFCEEGAYELGFFLEEAMTFQEEEEGFILTCQMKPKSDCVINVPASSLACKTAPDTVKATIMAVEILSETSFLVKVTADQEMSFLPGQYVNMSVPGTEQTRSYSFSSRPGAKEGSFLIRNLPGGVMSGYLAERATPGDVVELIGPMGAFYLRQVKRPLLFLAGGTGLAPFLSMLELLAESGTEQSICMYYAVTLEADLVEMDRLEALSKRLENFKLLTVVADKASLHLRKGFVTDHITAEDLMSGNVDVYLCGPPPMVEAVRDHMSELGISPANFYFEKFNPSDKVGS